MRYVSTGIIALVFGLFMAGSVHAVSLSSEESTFTQFELREGVLHYTYLFVPEKHAEQVDMDAEPNCFGKTEMLDKKKNNNFIEDIDGEFSGKLKVQKGDQEGGWTGAVSLTIQPMNMRYTIICGWISKMIEIAPGDWGSDNQIREFKSLQKKAETRALNDKKKSALKVPKGVDVTVSTTIRMAGSKKDENVSVFSLDVPGGAAFSPRPGDQKAIVGIFDVIVYEPVRILTMTLKTNDRKNSPLGRLYLTIDGKPADSFDTDYDVKNKTYFFRGLGDHAIANKLTKGKHRFAIRADIVNPGKKNILTDHFSVLSIKALTGKSVKIEMKKSINLKAFTVKHRAVKPGNEGQAYEEYVDKSMK